MIFIQHERLEFFKLSVNPNYTLETSFKTIIRSNPSESKIHTCDMIKLSNSRINKAYLFKSYFMHR